MSRPGDLFFYGAVAAILPIAIFDASPWAMLGVMLAVGWYLNERVRTREE
jgi:hypothetical protein